jgi:hypothetical protein
MNFSAFESGIKAPALKDVAAHWHEVRKDRAMPSWSDLKPSRIAAHLSNVWSFRYDAGADDFFGRLVGERIGRHIGKDFRGLRLADAYPAEAIGWAMGVFQRVVREPALYAYAGVMFTQMEKPGDGERIMMPLSSDGKTADGLLGATMFGPMHNAPMTLVMPSPDDERWFGVKVE